MFAILGALAGAASVGGLIYLTQTSASTAHSKGREKGRQEVLGELIKFGPNRLRRLCLELGARFIEPEEEDENEERELYEGLTVEIRAVLEAELRESLRAEVEDEMRTVLRGEVEGDAGSMERLKKEAKQLVKNDLTKSGAVEGEVRMELKREIRTELTHSGRDVGFVAQVMTDMREEIREALRSQMRVEVNRELRQEMIEDVRRELRQELKKEVKQKLKGDLSSEVRDTKAERFFETSAGVWTSDTALAGTWRR